jgi:hypothetical protein
LLEDTHGDNTNIHNFDVCSRVAFLSTYFRSQIELPDYSGDEIWDDKLIDQGGEIDVFQSDDDRANGFPFFCVVVLLLSLSGTLP